MLHRLDELQPDLLKSFETNYECRLEEVEFNIQTWLDFYFQTLRFK